MTERELLMFMAGVLARSSNDLHVNHNDSRYLLVSVSSAELFVREVNKMMGWTE